MTAKKSKWIRWSDNLELAVGFYWVALWNGDVELLFLDSEGEWSGYEDEDELGASTTSYIHTKCFYKIKKIIFPKHPVSNQSERLKDVK